MLSGCVCISASLIWCLVSSAVSLMCMMLGDVVSQLLCRTIVQIEGRRPGAAINMRVRGFATAVKSLEDNK